MYIPLSYRYLGMIGILWYPRGILFVSKTYKSDPSQTRFPVVFVLKNLLYPTILKKLSLVSKLLGNSLDKWFKWLIFYYVVWAGRTLVREMWFGNYFVWNAAKLKMENFRMKILTLNCLWKFFTNIHFWSWLFSNNLNQQLTDCHR